MVCSLLRSSTDRNESSCQSELIFVRTPPADCVIHNAEFARWAGSEMVDQAAIDGAKALAMTAIDFFTDEELRADVRAAFDAGAK